MPGSPYTDLDRPPLRATALRRALLVPGGLWTRLDLRAETGSTNADAAAAARAGEPEGLVVLAERQSAGRGRLGRVWTSPARAGIIASVLLRPGEARAGAGWAPVPAGRYGWLGLLTGVALVEAVSRVSELDAALKWPNDLLVGGAKCAGVLAEAVPGGAGGAPAVVLGVGLNVTLRAEELPPPAAGGLPATSLRMAGAVATDRDPLVRAILRALASWYGRWRDANGDPAGSGLRSAYLECCATVGQPVTALLPAAPDLTGTAVGVDDDGRLLVRTAAGDQAIAAADIRHLR
ncbi:MAG TPA: biotin--[acetyl-CoA-carboxylase] ligase [Pilimelia sp.]|nr:biotin--[acetyl-CoA-carboxylase] ligase [Pilimelia sp.]